MKKEYRIPVVWSMWGHMDIVAESEEQAKAIALDSETSLPEGHYVDDSIEVDEGTEIEVSDVISEEGNDDNPPEQDLGSVILRRMFS